MTCPRPSAYSDQGGRVRRAARQRQWSPELCALVDLPLGTLPPIVAPTAVAGRLRPEPAKALGLLDGTPVVVGASDTAVEDYGVGAIAADDAIVKMATAGNVNVMVGEPRPTRETLTYPHVIDGLWYSVTATNSCASSNRWFRDALGGEEVRGAVREAREIAEREPAWVPARRVHGEQRQPVWLAPRAGVHDVPGEVEALGHVQAEPPACVLVVGHVRGDVGAHAHAPVAGGAWDRERAARQVFRPKDSASE